MTEITYIGFQINGHSEHVQHGSQLVFGCPGESKKIGRNSFVNRNLEKLQIFNML